MQQSYGPFQGNRHLLEFLISAIFLIERDQGGRGPTILLGSFECFFMIRDQTNKRMSSFVCTSYICSAVCVCWCVLRRWARLAHHQFWSFTWPTPRTMNADLVIWTWFAYIFFPCSILPPTGPFIQPTIAPPITHFEWSIPRYVVYPLDSEHG